MTHAKKVSLINIAQYNYPYVIEKVVIVNAPFIFGACWQVISPFLPASAAALIGFANNNQEIEMFVDRENMPKGGSVWLADGASDEASTEVSEVKTVFVIDDGTEEEG